MRRLLSLLVAAYALRQALRRRGQRPVAYVDQWGTKFYGALDDFWKISEWPPPGAVIGPGWSGTAKQFWDATWPVLWEIPGFDPLVATDGTSIYIMDAHGLPRIVPNDAQVTIEWSGTRIFAI